MILATSLTVSVYKDRALNRNTMTHSGALRLTRSDVSPDNVIRIDASAVAISIASQYLVIPAQDMKVIT